MAESYSVPQCAVCGELLTGRDLDRSCCRDCRSPEGRVADLDIAIRASGDDPERIADWPEIRHLLRRRFRDGFSELELWERCADWLQAEGGLKPNGYLPLPLIYLRWLLDHGFESLGSGENQKPEALLVLSEELERLTNLNAVDEPARCFQSQPDFQPLISAVANLQPFYKGMLPKPAMGYWRRLLKAPDHEVRAAAESLLRWVAGEMESFQGDKSRTGGDQFPKVPSFSPASTTPERLESCLDPTAPIETFDNSDCDSSAETALGTDLPVGFLGGADLMNALGIHPSRRNAFERQLERRRKRLGDDNWQEVRDPRPNAPRFLYLASSTQILSLATSYKTPKPA